MRLDMRTLRIILKGDSFEVRAASRETSRKRFLVWQPKNPGAGFCPHKLC